MLETYKICIDNHPHAESYYRSLKEMYDSMGLGYHNWDHVENIIDLVSPYCPGNKAVFLAVFYHDCVYVPGKNDNELISAKYAHKDLGLLSVPLEIRDTVEHYIRATVHKEAVSDPALQYLLDADLAGLGFSWERYMANNKAIRKEFGRYSDEQWKTGRTAFIEIFLAKPRIYQSSEFFDTYEEQARDNLKRELELLK